MCLLLVETLHFRWYSANSNLSILFIMLADVMHVKECHCVHMKAAYSLIKLGSSSGSNLSPFSLLPHPRDQGTTHKCLRFSPASPPTFLTWPRCGITGVKHCMISLHFLRNYSASWSLLLYIPKTSIHFHYFSQKQLFHEYCGLEPWILNEWRRKMTLQGTMRLI
jgi:hypothetical protein